MNTGYDLRSLAANLMAYQSEVGGRLMVQADSGVVREKLTGEVILRMIQGWRGIRIALASDDTDALGRIRRQVCERLQGAGAAALNFPVFQGEYGTQMYGVCVPLSRLESQLPALCEAGIEALVYCERQFGSHAELGDMLNRSGVTLNWFTATTFVPLLEHPGSLAYYMPRCDLEDLLETVPSN